MNDRHGLTARLFKALAHPARVALLEALRSGPKCVCELVPMLGIEQPCASKHLAILRNEGLIAGEKDGQRVVYRLADDAALKFLDQGYGFLRSRWQRQEALWAPVRRPRAVGSP